LDISISNIQINPIKPQNSLVAFCSFEITQRNFRLYLGSISIHSSPSVGYRLVYPEKILWNGSKVNIICPLNKETQLMIQDAVIEQYEDIIAKVTNRREQKFGQGVDYEKREKR